MAAVNKKLINSVEDCVVEMLEGLQLAYPASLRLHSSCRKLVISTFRKNGHVSVLSGGGAGHEPFCGGYVGNGMLTAAISGTVFSSPPSSHIFQAIQLLSAGNNEAGVFVIIPNYTGDRLNFGLAIERARTNGIKVDSITVGEDCAHSPTKSDYAGRRGLCGLVLTFKIAGAMSDAGKSIEEIASTLQEVVKSMSTIGVCLSPCSLPGEGPSFSLEVDEIELGVGVHGESGVCRMKICSAKEITALMLKRISDYLEIEEHDEVVVLVNNLGSATQMEQCIVLNETYTQLRSQKVKIARIYAGHLMTSLDMSGIQVCILKLAKPKKQKEAWIKYLDSPTLAPAWPGGVKSIPPEKYERSSDDYPPVCPLSGKILEDDTNDPKIPQIGIESQILMKNCIEAATKAIIDEEARINFLDSDCGDSDCGTTLRRGAEGILEKLDEIPLDSPGEMMESIASICEPCMAGTSGGVYNLLFTSCITTLKSVNTMKIENLHQWANIWAKAWRAALKGAYSYCGAKPGDRTLFDVLEPACSAFESSPKGSTKQLMEALDICLEAAESGCRSTKLMKARVGRASYVYPSLLHEYDAGAYGALVWIRAVIEVIKNHFGDDDNM